jgi:flagellar protein FlaG
MFAKLWTLTKDIWIATNPLKAFISTKRIKALVPLHKEVKYMDVNVQNPQISQERVQPQPQQQPTTQPQQQTQAIQAPVAPPNREPVAPQSSPPTRNNLRQEDVSDFMIDRAFRDANRALEGGAFRLSYGIHEATNRVTVSVYDSETGEVIRELPSEDRLDLYARITEFTGLFFDETS